MVADVGRFLAGMYVCDACGSVSVKVNVFPQVGTFCRGRGNASWRVL